MGKKIEVAEVVRQAYGKGLPPSHIRTLQQIGEGLVRNMLLMIEPNEQAELREGLRDTPKRVVKSWGELYAGYDMKPEEILKTTFKQEGYNYDEMVLCKNIELYSTCEHHVLPFYGRAHVAYIPSDRVVGLSKLARLTDAFARRLQIQEKLTNQIADAIDTILKPKGVGVIIEAKHHCMCSRGAGKQNSSMVTSCLRGVFKTQREVRTEFLALTKD